MRSPTWCRLELRRVRLRTVLYDFGFSDNSISRYWYCAESNSAQYHTGQSHVFREYLQENGFFSKTILDCLSGTQIGWINEKKVKKISWHCLFKPCLNLTTIAKSCLVRVRPTKKSVQRNYFHCNVVKRKDDIPELGHIFRDMGPIVAGGRRIVNS